MWVSRILRDPALPHVQSSDPAAADPASLTRRAHLPGRRGAETLSGTGEPPADPCPPEKGPSAENGRAY